MYPIPSAPGAIVSPATTPAGIVTGLPASAGTIPATFPEVPDPVMWQGVPFAILAVVIFFSVIAVFATLAKVKLPAPSVVTTCPAIPSVLGYVNPLAVSEFDTTKDPVTLRVVPSNEKLGSPFIVPVPVAVSMQLSTLFVIAPAMDVTLSAYDAVIALELDTAQEADVTLFDPKGPNTFDPVINEAVSAKELEIALEELTAKDELTANEEVVANDELIAKEELTALELDIAKDELTACEELTAHEEVPNKEPVNAVDVTDVSPANDEPVAPKAMLVVPTISDGLAKLALVIPAVPDKLESVSPVIVPDSVMFPEVVIGPPPKVIPLTVPEADTEVTVPVPAAVVVSILPVESNANNPVTVPGNADVLLYAGSDICLVCMSQLAISASLLVFEPLSILSLF